MTQMSNGTNICGTNTGDINVGGIKFVPSE